MIGRKQRTTFLAVGAVSFLLGLLMLGLWRIFDEFALLVMGPCFMLTGVTWTIVILLAFKFAKIPEIENSPEPVPAETPRERSRGRIRLSESGFVDPTHCFCEMSPEEMRVWARKRTVDHVPTMMLLQMTESVHEREVISMVSMLDVDNETLLSTMVDVDMPDDHILQCRDATRRMLGME